MTGEISRLEVRYLPPFTSRGNLPIFKCISVDTLDCPHFKSCQFDMAWGFDKGTGTPLTYDVVCQECAAPRLCEMFGIVPMVCEG